MLPRRLHALFGIDPNIPEKLIKSHHTDELGVRSDAARNENSYAARLLIKALPLTALNDALRAVMNDGAGVVELLLELANLGLWAIVGYVVAMRIFRWQ